VENQNMSIVDKIMAGIVTKITYGLLHMVDRETQLSVDEKEGMFKRFCTGKCLR
jgi:hypothetical protein